MVQNRRFFLKALGAGVAVLSLPEISLPLNWFGFSGIHDKDLKTLLHELLIGQGSGGPFVAHADTRLIEGSPQKLYRAPLGFLKMLDGLGMTREFSGTIDYEEASQCKPHFQRQEEVWRKNNLTSFTDVKRADADHDVAIAVGGIIDQDHSLIEALGATQFQNDAAVPLSGNDPAITIAARWLLDKNLGGKEIAQSLALTDKRQVAIDGRSNAMRYETPVSASVYIPRVRLNSQVRNGVGMIAANTKRDPDRIYLADVYA